MPEQAECFRRGLFVGSMMAGSQKEGFWTDNKF